MVGSVSRTSGRECVPSVREDANGKFRSSNLVMASRGIGQMLSYIAQLQPDPYRFSSREVPEGPECSSREMKSKSKSNCDLRGWTGTSGVW